MASPCHGGQCPAAHAGIRPTDEPGGHLACTLPGRTRRAWSGAGFFPSQGEPAGEEGEATERGDGPEPAQVAKSQSVEGAAENGETGEEEAGGQTRRAFGTAQRDQHGRVDEVI